MKFEKRIQRRARIAALAAFAMWCVALIVMFVGSTFWQRPPTSRWFVVLGPLFVVVAVDQIINSEWHSTKWSSVERDPDFYVRLGILGVVVGVGVLAVGLVTSASLTWFQ